MLDRLVRKKIAYLILLAITGQILLGFYEVKTYSGPAEEKASYFLSAGKFYSEAETAFITSDHQNNNEFFSLSEQLPDFIGEPVNICMTSKNNYYYRQKVPDSRRKIRIMIHPRFHGSRYKEWMFHRIVNLLVDTISSGRTIRSVIYI